ncbi:hypothetical protein RJT34_06801 [Clitoria ternatea]|uniref:Uncharacterized protein n=1 Tax=Clitoria ternatea TaxID=43366 RepID=A0AAN9K5Z1_CLITE
MLRTPFCIPTSVHLRPPQRVSVWLRKCSHWRFPFSVLLSPNVVGVWKVHELHAFAYHIHISKTLVITSVQLTKRRSPPFLKRGCVWVRQPPPFRQPSSVRPLPNSVYAWVALTSLEPTAVEG